MTKRNKESSDQGSLFDYLHRVEELHRQSTDPAPGSLFVEPELKAAMKEDLRYASDEEGRALSQAEVATRMSDSAGGLITEDMINNWTAPSHPHCIPAKWLPGRRKVSDLPPPRISLSVKLELG
jgi:hypothetical protein